MSDRWWASLTVENAPAEWTRVVECVDYHGSTFEQRDLALDAMPDDLSATFQQLGSLEEVAYDDGRLTVSDFQLVGGSYCFEEQGVLDALKSNGYAFSAYDEGAYEYPGTYHFWRPGLGEVQQRLYLTGYGIAIDAVGLRALLTVGKVDLEEHPELDAALREYFDHEWRSK
jgi:hypothetical protein